MALACFLGVAFAAAGGASAKAPGTIVVLRLSGVVDPFEASYIKGNIEAAADDHANAVVLTIDTPGGLDSSMRTITQAILNSLVPVITYVSPEGARAASAGTFILLAGSVAAMAPGTNVGAAHPVGVSGAIEQSKVLNDAVATIRAIAHARGRNENWAERAVRDSVSISANEALRLHPPVIDLIAPNLNTLLRGINGERVPAGNGRTVVLHTAGQTLESKGLGLGATILHGLLSPDLAFIFFYLGVGLVVLGFIHHPVALVFGALSLIASFVSFGMLPVQLVGVALLVASAAFFLLELKAPGIGAFTAAGVITLVLGGLFLFNPSVPNARVSPGVIVPVALAAIAFFGFAVRAALRARRRPPTMRIENLVGREGVVTTALTPRGVVHVASESWTADSVAGSIPKGSRVRVVGTTGLRLQVAPVDGETVESAPVARGAGGEQAREQRERSNLLHSPGGSEPPKEAG
jgi:membrane-bound serine protease (ClpP class)